MERLELSKKSLLLSNVILLVFVIYLLNTRSESYRDKQYDTLISIASEAHRTEDLDRNTNVFQHMNALLNTYLGREVEIEWAGIEWGHTSTQFRTHATTNEGKRYLITMQLHPHEEEDTIELLRNEVIDVTDTVSAAGL